MTRDELDRIEEKMLKRAEFILNEFRNDFQYMRFADVSAALTLVDAKLRREEMIAKIGGSR